MTRVVYASYKIIAYYTKNAANVIPYS